MSRAKNDGLLAAFGCFGLVAAIPLMLAYCVAVDGFALMMLWRWFVVPAFGLAPLSLAMACGLDTLWTFMRGVPPETDDEGKGALEVLAKPFIRHGVRLAFILAIGYTLHRWFL